MINVKSIFKILGIIGLSLIGVWFVLPIMYFIILMIMPGFPPSNKYVTNYLQKKYNDNFYVVSIPQETSVGGFFVSKAPSRYLIDVKSKKYPNFKFTVVADPSFLFQYKNLSDDYEDIRMNAEYYKRIKPFIDKYYPGAEVSELEFFNSYATDNFKETYNFNFQQNLSISNLKVKLKLIDYSYGPPENESDAEFISEICSNNLCPTFFILKINDGELEYELFAKYQNGITNFVPFEEVFPRY